MRFFCCKTSGRARMLSPPAPARKRARGWRLPQRSGMSCPVWALAPFIRACTRLMLAVWDKKWHRAWVRPGDQRVRKGWPPDPSYVRNKFGIIATYPLTAILWRILNWQMQFKFSSSPSTRFTVAVLNALKSKSSNLSPRAWNQTSGLSFYVLFCVCAVLSCTAPYKIWT